VVHGVLGAHVGVDGGRRSERGLLGRYIYTDTGAPWSGLAPLLTRRLLGANGRTLRWFVPSRTLNRSREAPLFGREAA
jgi:hypothetical protein